MADGSTREADVFLFTSADASGFAGLNRGLENELGVSFTNVDAGIAIFHEIREDDLDPEIWTSLKVAFDRASLSGGPELLTFEASDGLVALNQSIDP